jgi:hypothetical protein
MRHKVCQVPRPLVTINLEGGTIMSIIYIVGLVVVVLFVLRFLNIV